MKTLAAAVLMIALVGCKKVVPQVKPCPQPAPKIEIHATANERGGFSVDTKCPRGWHVQAPPGTNDAYNNGPHMEADLINLLVVEFCEVDAVKPGGRP